MDDELLDLVNDRDEVVGTITRRKAQEKGVQNFRVVNAFLRNRRGELWIPRRQASKQTFPLCRDMSVGGHVMSGENYRVAIERELREELNITDDAESIRFLGHLTPQKDGVSSFMNIYEIETDVTPVFNQDDHIDGEWLSTDNLLARILSGEPAKDDLLRLIQKFYSSAPSKA